jgi:hypothetical protein
MAYGTWNRTLQQCWEPHLFIIIIPSLTSVVAGAYYNTNMSYLKSLNQLQKIRQATIAVYRLTDNYWRNMVMCSASGRYVWNIASIRRGKRTEATRYDICCMRILWTVLYWPKAHGRFAVRPIPCLVAKCRKVQISEHYLLPYTLCNTVRAPYMGKPWTCKAHIGITKAIVFTELLVYIIRNYVKRQHCHNSLHCSCKLTRISLIS